MRCCGSGRFLLEPDLDLLKCPDPETDPVSDSDLNKFSAKFLLKIDLLSKLSNVDS
jgi:hypothetical protein